MKTSNQTFLAKHYQFPLFTEEHIHIYKIIDTFTHQRMRKAPALHGALCYTHQGNF